MTEPEKYYVASYWHQYCEPSSVAIGIDANAVEKAVEAEIADEQYYSRNWSDCDCPDDARCTICTPVFGWSGVHAEQPGVVMSDEERTAYLAALLSGEVVWLER